VRGPPKPRLGAPTKRVGVGRLGVGVARLVGRLPAPTSTTCPKPARPAPSLACVCVGLERAGIGEGEAAAGAPSFEAAAAAPSRELLTIDAQLGLLGGAAAAVAVAPLAASSLPPVACGKSSRGQLVHIPNSLDHISHLYHT
jgi:hypothetical protein